MKPNFHFALIALSLTLLLATSHAADAPKPRPPAPPIPEAQTSAFKVFVFGDSNCAGYGPFVVAGIASDASDYGPFNLTELRSMAVSTADYFVHAASYPGKTAMQSLPFLTGRRGEARETLPAGQVFDVIFYQMGTNDSAHRKDYPTDQAFVAAVKEGMEKAIACLKNTYKAKTIYIALPPPVFGPDANDPAKAATVSAWSNYSMELILPAMREIAAANGIKVIDVNSVFKGKDKEYGRGVHYNDSGKKKVAELYLDAIRGDIEPVKFFAIKDEKKETEITAMQAGKVRVKTAFVNNTLPAKDGPKIMAVLYKKNGNDLTVVQSKSLGEQITPTNKNIQADFDVPADGSYVIKMQAWRDAAMTTPNGFASSSLRALE
jgi:lysophospholipase L1-like esterase